MKITTKGQVTIPQYIREHTGMLPHTEVEFLLRDGEVVVRPTDEAEGYRRGRRIVEEMRGRATTGMTTDEILALTRPKT